MTSYSSWIKKAALVLVWTGLLCACNDDPMVDNPTGGINPDGTVEFRITVPGYVAPTRAGGSFDAPITTLHLYLFDVKGKFIGVVEADAVEGETLDSGDKDQTLETDAGTGAATEPSPGNGEGHYRASIPQNTEVVHFIANAPSDFWPGDANTGLDMNYYLGLTQEEVMAPMTTSGQLYWGCSTYGNLTLAQQPVILYRNYAKVQYEVLADDKGAVIAENIVGIDGWVLCNRPQNATVAPFDADAIGQPKGPFHFNLLSADSEGSRYVSLPVPDERTASLLYGPYVYADAGKLADGDLTANQGEPQPIFDHTVEAYGDGAGVYGEEVFALFKIRTAADGGGEETKYYKIKLLKETVSQGVVTNRYSFDIKRNHIYTILFRGINPDLGYPSIEEAMKGNAANNTLVDVEESLPELQSATSILRVENGTVRYIDNLASRYPATEGGYQVNDLYIYYESSVDDASLSVQWVADSCSLGTESVPEETSLSIREKGADDPEGDYTHVVSFVADEFAFGDNGDCHYKEGLIRIQENQGVLSRFVRIFMGDPITFRPLLISSDIPAMTDERLTVAFTVPDERFLPAQLYPIEVRFGSDRIDVEKSLAVDALKVDLVKTDYSGILQYKQGSDGWGWYADKTGSGTDEYWATSEEWLAWGYKYTYTIENPAEAGEHRITLRTVSREKSDFSVIMEGMSTTIMEGTGDAGEANVFNTRELRFKVQPEATNETARRIMLDGGLYNTRLTTRYVNVPKPATGNTVDVEIPYTLGFYSDAETTDDNTVVGHRLADETVTGKAPVKLWVYFRPEELTPTGAWAEGKSVKVDPEGNSYVAYEATSPEGVLTFTTTSLDVKNSLVFITARSYDGSATGDANTYTPLKHPYWGDYSTSSHASAATPAHGADYLYTGVNPGSRAYRSASALVSVLGEWEFNAVISDDMALFPQESELEVPYGLSNTDASHDFFVRIDRPSGVADIQLVVTPEVAKAVKLVANNDSYTVTNDGSDGNPITLTLGEHDSIYSVLRFRPLSFDHAGSLTFSSTSYSAQVNHQVNISHTPIAVQGINYILRSEYDHYRTVKEGIETQQEIVLDNKFSSSLNIDPVAGQQFVVRVYFPASLSFRMSDDDAGYFTFRFASLKSKVLPNSDLAGTNVDCRYELLEDDVIRVYGLRKIYYNADGVQVANSGTTELNYIDLLLESTEGDSDETMRLSTGNDLRFYRYSVGIGNRVVYAPQSDKVTYEWSTDNKTWTTIQSGDILTNLSDNLYEKGQTAYLRVTYPVNDNEDVVDFTLKTSGFKVTGCRNGGGEVAISSLMTVYDETGAVTTGNNGDGYGWTYVLEGIPTVKAAKGQFTLTLETIGYGLADRLEMKGENDDIIVEERSTTLATQLTIAENSLGWALRYAGAYPQTQAESRSGDGNAIFDVGTQINQVSTDGGYTYPDGYTYASKMNNVAGISFYAPYPGMKLAVGVTQRKTGSNDGLSIYYQDGSEPVFHSAMITGNTPMTELAYELGAAGVYHLKSHSGEFFLYYLNLQKAREEGQLGTITWAAADTDGSPAWSLTNANGTQISFPTSSGTVTGNTLVASDFAEQLTLTFGELAEGETATLTLPESGDYAFWVGEEKVYTAQVSRGGSLTLVPAAGGELVEKPIQLSGFSAKYTYVQDIHVVIRPYLEVATNLGDFPFRNDNHVKLAMGDEAKMYVRLTDAQHAGKEVSFIIGGNNWMDHLQPLEYPEGWGGLGETVTLTNVQQGAEAYFKWRVNVGGAVTDANKAIMQIRGEGSTDIYVGGNILKPGSLQNLYPYVNTYAMFKSSGDPVVHGCIQYSTDGGETWQYVYGTGGESDILQAEQGAHYRNYDGTNGAPIELPVGADSYIRVSVPKTGAITSAHVTVNKAIDANLAAQNVAGATVDGVTVVATSDADWGWTSDGWATFKVSNPETEGLIYTLQFTGSTDIFAEGKNQSATTYVKLVPVETWRWKDIHLDLTEQGLLTTEEYTNKTPVEYGVRIADDGTALRREATDAAANAVISGQYHNNHGWYYPKLVLQVEGPVRIGVGNCTFAGGEVTVTDDLNNVVSSFVRDKECWQLGKEDHLVSYGYYTGGATTLTINAPSYVPYISVEKLADVPKAVHKVTYHQEAYTTAGATYTPYAAIQHLQGASLEVPSAYPKESDVAATHWVKVTTDGTKETRVLLNATETVGSDMTYYPVWPVMPGNTATTIRSIHVYETSGTIFTKGTDQLIDSSNDGAYILFEVKPTASGWYSFSSNISANGGDNPQVTLGYVDANGNYVVSEKKNIVKNNNWSSDDNYRYTWYFDLAAGQTYSFKMQCHVSSGYCVNVYEMNVQPAITDVYEYYYDADAASGSSPTLHTTAVSGANCEVAVTPSTTNSNGYGLKSTTRQITLYDGTELTLSNALEVNGNTTISFTIPVAMKLTLHWMQIGNDESKINYLKIAKDGEEFSTKPTEAVTASTDRTSEYELPLGTYTIGKGGSGGNPWLYYFSLVQAGGQ